VGGRGRGRVVWCLGWGFMAGRPWCVVGEMVWEGMSGLMVADVLGGGMSRFSMAPLPWFTIIAIPQSDDGVLLM